MVIVVRPPTEPVVSNGRGARALRDQRGGAEAGGMSTSRHGLVALPPYPAHSPQRLCHVAEFRNNLPQGAPFLDRLACEPAVFVATVSRALRRATSAGAAVHAATALSRHPPRPAWAAVPGFRSQAGGMSTSRHGLVALCRHTRRTHHSAFAMSRNSATISRRARRSSIASHVNPPCL